MKLFACMVCLYLCNLRNYTKIGSIFCLVRLFALCLLGLHYL